MTDSTVKVCKILLLGNGSVGKTSIIQRFTQNGFQKVYQQTVGCDFYERKIALQGDVHLTIQVWDIGGQSLNSKMIQKYLYGSRVIFLCYDVTDPNSFSDVDEWRQTVLKSNKDPITGQSEKLPAMFLVGNKIDLLHLRKISEEKHQAYIRDNELTGGFTLSAQTGEQVMPSFFDAIAKGAEIYISDVDRAAAEIIPGVSISQGAHEEMRTADADEIERQDREAEEQRKKEEERRKAGGCQCTVC